MITYDDFTQLARWAGFDEPRETAFTYDGPTGPGEYNWYYAKWKLRDFPSECVINPEWLLSYYEDPQDEANSFACFEVDRGAARKISLVHSASELKSMLEPYRKGLVGYLEDHAEDAIGWIDRRLFEAAISAPDLFGHVTNNGLRADLAAISSHRFASIGWEGEKAFDAIHFLEAANFALPEWFESGGGFNGFIPSFLKSADLASVIIENHSVDGDLPWLSLSFFTKTANPIYPLIETGVPLAATDVPSADGLGLYESLVSDLYQFDFSAPSWRILDEIGLIAKSDFDYDMKLDEAWDDCITDSMQVLREEYERQNKGEER
jgi:hypothetical protein